MKKNFSKKNKTPEFFKSLSWEILISSRYLSSQNKDGFVSVIAGFSFLGICIGVMALIIVMSVMGGFREELITKIVGLKGNVLVYNPTSPLPSNNIIVDKIKSIKEVNGIYPLIERQAIVSVDNQSIGVLTLSMPYQAIIERKIISNSLTLQEPLTENSFSGNVVLIGKRMAEYLGIVEGDYINVMSPNGENTPWGSIPRQQEFEVLGFFEIGMEQYDKNIIIMPLKTAQDFFNLTNSISQIEVFVNDVEKSDEIAKKIQQILYKDGERKINALSWKHSEANFFQALQMEKHVMFLILSLIILIAAFNIVSGLVMLVNDKRKDIAIMKTIGASKASVVRIFLMTGSTIGLTGTAIGVILGIIGTLNINSIFLFLQKILGIQLFYPEFFHLSKMPYKLDYKEITFIAVLSLILSIVSTIYPAFRAARLNPTEILRR